MNIKKKRNKNLVLIFYYKYFEARDTIKKIRDYLKNYELRTIEVSVFRDNKGFQYEDFSNISDTIPLDKVILGLSLGGDGTLLFMAQQLKEFKIPIIGVNLGQLGFLTWFSSENVLNGINEFLNGNAEIDRRMMLDITIKKDLDKLYLKNSQYSVNNRVSINENSEYSFIALNEISISKYNLSTPIEIRIDIDGDFLSMVKGDGVIVSTPTGSTGYSLSAGGPIICPSLDAMIITPICPHSFTIKPIIIREHHILNLYPAKNRKIIITADGQRGKILGKDEFVEIKKSDHYTFLVKNKELNFFRLISKKLRWGME